MGFKTIQIFDPACPLDLSPDLDRFAHPHPITREKLTDFVNRGELPRYRGPEVQFVPTDTELKIIMHWKSREVAQEYADFVWQSAIEWDPHRTMLRSVEVIED